MPKKILLFIISSFFIFTSLISFSKANINENIILVKNSSMYNNLKGKIIIKLGDSGKAYYIHPQKKEMYYLGNPSNAFNVMREQGLGITNVDLEKIPIGFASQEQKNINFKFSNKHKGKIFIQVEKNGEAWYVHPDTAERHYLGRPYDAFNIMKNFGLGISNESFNRLINP